MAPHSWPPAPHAPNGPNRPGLKPTKARGRVTLQVPILSVSILYMSTPVSILYVSAPR